MSFKIALVSVNKKKKQHFFQRLEEMDHIPDEIKEIFDLIS